MFACLSLKTMKRIALFAKKALRFSGILIFLIMISLLSEGGNTPKSFDESSISLNPACKIKRMSNGEVIIYAKNREGSEVKHKFTDFYADLLMAAYHKQRIEFIVDTFSRKYYLSQDDCRREIKHAVNVLAEWDIIVREEQIALR
jgi:hypothetical protein